MPETTEKSWAQLWREKHQNDPQFTFDQKVIVTDWFYKGHKWMINDINEIIPANNPNPGDPEIVTIYQVRFYTPLGVIARVVDAKNLEAYEWEKVKEEETNDGDTKTNDVPYRGEVLAMIVIAIFCFFIGTLF